MSVPYPTLPPRLVPFGWRLAQKGEDGEAYVNEERGLSVIWSTALELDGRAWLHVSIAGQQRMPTWEELVFAKEWIGGTDTGGYQVLPPRSQWVNQHPRALHVFIPLEGEPPLPDFTRGGPNL